MKNYFTWSMAGRDRKKKKKITWKNRLKKKNIMGSHNFSGGAKDSNLAWSKEIERQYKGRRKEFEH